MCYQPNRNVFVQTQWFFKCESQIISHARQKHQIAVQTKSLISSILKNLFLSFYQKIFVWETVLFLVKKQLDHEFINRNRLGEYYLDFQLSDYNLFKRFRQGPILRI